MKLKILYFCLVLSLFQTSFGQKMTLSPQVNNILGEIEAGYILYGIEEIKNLSKKNDLAAQFYLGECYEFGIGINQDLQEAFRYFRRTAERGLPDAMLKLSGFYKEGKGVAQDLEKSDYWLSRYKGKGGEQRFPGIADYYNKGITNPQNYALNPNKASSGTGSNNLAEEKRNTDNPAQNPIIIIQQVQSQYPDKEGGSQEIKPSSGEVVSDVDVKIPQRSGVNNKMFALIIANEDYSRVESVANAKKDGRKVKEYFNKTLGIPDAQIAYLENATLNDMRYELNRLAKISEAYKGDCSFIIYYTGHGIPDEKDGKGYLLPVDGYGNDVTTGYSLDELYAGLGALESEKTILITDACFSGAGKDGDMLVAARGVALKTKPSQTSGKLIAISACQSDETAYSYKEKGHGLLTYFFLKKLQESKGNVTLGELEEYLVDNVGKTSIVFNGKPQTPNISVSPALKSSWGNIPLAE